ncbi:MAG: bifunctional aspartate kinase/homoserine dehydrogenase I [Pseudomonadota bacterium]
MRHAEQWHVHKFGGSSLSDAACFRRVRDLIVGAQQRGQRSAVVVSAMGGMTDALLEIAAAAVAGGDDLEASLEALQTRYEQTAAVLLDPGARVAILDAWQQDLAAIRELLQALRLLGSAPQRTHDIIAGFGEIWSSRLLCALLAQDIQSASTRWLDARDVVVVTQTRLGASVKWQTSQERCDAHPALIDSDIAVVTGFIATDTDGLQTTLGRNGSDHSAAIFAALLRAKSLTIWTDVPGVMSGDPRQIPEARVIENLSYSEAMELAYFGAKVIHPQTMGPAIANAIPIYIRSTFEPERAGTCVSADSGRDLIKGTTSIDGVAVINVEGSGMIGVPGTAHRIFRALSDADISVTLISQASSEHSVCFVVSQSKAQAAAEVVREAFSREIERRQIQDVSVLDDCSILAVVGDRMTGLPGIAGRFLDTLGKAGINVIAMAQGSSEKNISVVVRSCDTTRAIRAVHSSFYLSTKTFSIGVIGPGNVGAELLRQIDSQSQRLAERFNLDLRIRAVTTRSRMLVGQPRIQLDDWADQLRARGSSADLDAFVEHIDADHLPHAVIVDCTADDAIAARYPEWLARGIHVVAPNKKAFSGELSLYQDIMSTASRHGSHCFYETTVGAALPIIQTLQGLRETGDHVYEVQGVFSGTLAYLFNRYDGAVPFSHILRDALEQGFTEPDPRDDLSGTDVARKLVIVARELGYEVGLGDVNIESLVPDGLEQGDVATFMQQVDVIDGPMLARFEAARQQGRSLRYLGSLDTEGRLRVALEPVPADSPFSHLALTDNLVQIRSERYNNNPLVIQGPGAGPAVTAGGVFADILRVASQLGNPR